MLGTIIWSSDVFQNDIYKKYFPEKYWSDKVLYHEKMIQEANSSINTIQKLIHSEYIEINKAKLNADQTLVITDNQELSEIVYKSTVDDSLKFIDLLDKQLATLKNKLKENEEALKFATIQLNEYSEASQ